jgi:CelD/BcsL family acetyltransferase involved in cellulose biosynthesis
MSAACGTGLTVQAVDLPDVGPELLQAWGELADVAVEPNPCFAPEMLLPAVRHLAGGQGVRLWLVWSGDQLILAVPIGTRRYLRLPVPVWTTWRHPYRYVGTPLVRPGFLDSAPAALLAALAASGAPGCLVLEQVYLDGPVAVAFRDAAAGRRAHWAEHDVWGRPTVYAREEETYLDDTLGSRSVRTLRRQRRHLERDLGPVEARDVTRAGSPAVVQAEVEDFLAMESTGWKGRAGTALASDPAHAAFWREFCSAEAAAGRLQLWQLRAGDVVAARQCHVRQGGVVFHLKTTYDETLSKASPGVLLELDLLHAFHVDPALRLLDPCTDSVPGPSDRLYPDVRRLGDALVGLTVTGRMLARLTPPASGAWRRLQDLIRRR